MRRREAEFKRAAVRLVKSLMALHAPVATFAIVFSNKGTVIFALFLDLVARRMIQQPFRRACTLPTGLNLGVQPMTVDVLSPCFLLEPIVPKMEGRLGSDMVIMSVQCKASEHAFSSD